MICTSLKYSRAKRFRVQPDGVGSGPGLTDQAKNILGR